MNDKRIAVIGTGNMGGALLRGMLKTEWGDPDNFVASDIDSTKLKELADVHKIKTTTDNRKAISGANIIILAVKPQILDQVIDEIKDDLTADQILISVAAGVRTSHIHSRVNRDIPIIRAMPNIAALVDESSTAISGGKFAREEHLKQAKEVLGSIGIVVEVRENLMDAVTGLSGTGPMYVFLLVEGLSDAGVKVGLSRDISNTLSIHTVLGAATIMRETGWHPARLKDMVTSPGGTAISALHSLEKSGMRAMLIDAVETATKRSQELGKPINDND